MLPLNHNDKELLSFLREASLNTILKGKDQGNTPYLKHIFRLHQILFGEVCTGCPTKINGYIKKVQNYNIPTMSQENQNSSFQLRKGAMIIVPGTSTSYSNHNLTDEVAIKLLKANPNRRSIFISVPDNLEELLNEEPKSELITIFEKEFTIEQAIELLSKIEVNTKASTVSGIEKKLDKLSEEQLNALEGIVNPE